MSSSPNSKQKYERIAAFYDLLDWPFEQFRYRHIRPTVFEGIHGRILDTGVGTGRNIPYYPAGAHVVGIDQSPAMLKRARQRCRLSSASVELKQMDITALEFSDASFDAAVATFLFCTLPEDHHTAGLGELCRVVKPGGQVRLLEFMRDSKAPNPPTRLWDPVIDWAYGASFDRQTERHVIEAGLTIERTIDLVDGRLKLIVARTPPKAGETQHKGASGALD